ncbi:MAG TPA: helix-turn-helix domain-containing protein [Oscillatoriales cyanobacterium M59_W2019_021]|nr:helix-turn-helix domain-containing protein [Oscillatoriales cyanobacterium M4454_W2019_049]HIK52188.1 helix-turn-helix domain-containing protein [Oscillatoriales cyanobacterium M59_W2019_021]
MNVKTKLSQISEVTDDWNTLKDETEKSKTENLEREKFDTETSEAEKLDADSFEIVERFDTETSATEKLAPEPIEIETSKTEETRPSFSFKQRLWNLLQKTKSDSEPTPADILAELGDRLYQVRQSQMLSLDDVAARTLIAPKVLGAIETGNLAELPEPVYVRGFIRRFADALGLDGTEFASQFPISKVDRPKPSNWQTSPAAQLRPLHLYMLYVGLVVFSISSLSHSMNSSRSDTPSPSADSNTVEAPSKSETPKSNATAKPQAKMVSAQTAPPKSQKVQVEITVTEASWISVTSDGKVAFEGTLSEGKHTWEANEQLTISAGNAGGILITHNGSQAKKMGELGAVEEVTFRADDPSRG